MGALIRGGEAKIQPFPVCSFVVTCDVAMATKMKRFVLNSFKRIELCHPAQ